jgi:hypothetical protein
VIGLQQLWERWAGVPFGYGTFDCAILAAWWLDERTGSRHSDWLRSLRYDNGRSAIRLVRAAGGLRAGVIKQLGQPLTANALRDGDIGVLRLGHRGVVEVLGILAPQQVLIAAPKGLAALPLRHAVVEGWPCRKL